MYNSDGGIHSGRTQHAPPHAPQHKPLAHARAAPGPQVLRMQCTREAVHHTPDGIADAPPQLHNQPNTQDIQGGRAGTRETTRQRARNSPPSKTGDAQRTSRKPLSSPKGEAKSSPPKLPTQRQTQSTNTLRRSNPKRLCFLALLSEQQDQKTKTPLLAHSGVPWFESRQ